jgi:DNA-binding transcriptional MerR regulator
MVESGIVVLALSAEHVARLTGLTMRQLAYWDRIGFFKPEYAANSRRSPNSRIYSFQDAVDLRTISVLMNIHGVSLPHLKDVAAKLASYTGRPWSELRLRVWNRRVQFDEPETGAARDVLHGQYVLLPIIEVIQDVEKGLQELRKRDDDQIGRFERHRYVSHNKLVLAGTRVPVSTVLEYIHDGYATADILQEFPSLTVDDVEAVRDRGEAAIAA